MLFFYFLPFSIVFILLPAEYELSQLNTSNVGTKLDTSLGSVALGKHPSGPTSPRDVFLRFYLAKNLRSRYLTLTSLDQPVIGYNVIEEITRKSSAETKGDDQPPFLDVLFCSLRNIERCKVEALVTIIHSEKTNPLCNVKTTKSYLINLPGQSVKVPCHVKVGPLHRPIPVLFEPNPECLWDDGIEIPETLTVISRGSRVNIQVYNESKHKVVLKRRTVLGTLQMVRSVTPLDVMQSEVNSKETVFAETKVVRKEWRRV